MVFISQLVVLFSLVSSVVALADEPAGAKYEIKEAFTDGRGHYIIEARDSNMDPSKDELGGKRIFFWGDKRELTRILIIAPRAETEPEDYTKNYDDLQSDLTFQWSKISRKGKTLTVTDGVPNLQGELKRVILNQVPNDELALLKDRLDSGKVKINLVQNPNHGHHLFQIKGTNTFIYAVLGYGPVQRVWIGEPGKMQEAGPLEFFSLGQYSSNHYIVFFKNKDVLITARFPSQDRESICVFGRHNSKLYELVVPVMTREEIIKLGMKEDVPSFDEVSTPTDLVQGNVLNNGETKLMRALWKKKPRELLLKYLEEENDINDTDDQHWNAAMVALVTGQDEIFTKILEKPGFDPFRKNDDGGSVVSMAADHELSPQARAALEKVLRKRNTPINPRVSDK